MATHDDGVMVPRGPGMGRLVHLAGAVASVALVAGMVVWGYQLAVRDVHGVPVVRALEGPMRVAPTVPGGEVTEHQGLAVNQVAANGMAAPLPDSVTLAPQPAELADEDVAGLIGPALPDPALTSPALAEPALPSPEVVTAFAPVPPPAALLIPAEEATAAAIAAALAEATAGMPEAAPVTDTAPAAELPARAMARPVPRPPLPTPLPPETATAASAETALAAAPAVEVEPANVAPGTILIQLDAFDSADDARAGWATIAGRFPDAFADKALLLDEATSGGMPFWRLRAAGFDSVDAARAFCEGLRAGGATCIPVAHE